MTSDLVEAARGCSGPKSYREFATSRRVYCNPAIPPPQHRHRGSLTVRVLYLECIIRVFHYSKGEGD